MIPALLILHLFSVILWMGGLLAVTSLMRLASNQPAPAKEQSYALARQLLSAGANPGALAAIILGAALLIERPALLYQGWLHAKLFLVLVVLLIHGRLYLRARVLETEPSYPATARQFVVAHGMLSVLLLLILFLVLVRPF